MSDGPNEEMRQMRAEYVAVKEAQAERDAERKRANSAQVERDRARHWLHNVMVRAKEANARADAAEARAKAVLDILDGDAGFLAETVFRKDGKASKHDMCKHGEREYDGCVSCLTDAIRAALAPPA